MKPEDIIGFSLTDHDIVSNKIRAKKGFTLIELLVVIAIIGLISSVILASLSRTRMKARDMRRISDLRQITMALELYFDDHNYYPGTEQTGLGCVTPPCWDVNILQKSNDATWIPLAADLVPYIKPLPVDPINSPCNNWTNGCFMYFYGNVGRTGISITNGLPTTPNVYDLVAQLEDQDNPKACKQMDYIYKTGSQSSSLYWCQHGATYSPGIYDPSPN